MRAWKNLLAAAVVVLPALALAAPGDGESTFADLQKQPPTFCPGVYALCIKAACAGIPRLGPKGEYSMDHALCTCEVVEGWSMGPQACSDRATVTQNGRTFLISTYSNLFNQTALNGLNNTLTCNNKSTLWAWCYGSPCVVDKDDTTKATCTCPLVTSRMSTLGGSCRDNACNGIWSATWPAADKFANDHFANYMKNNQPGVPYNPPAQACIAQ